MKFSTAGKTVDFSGVSVVLKFFSPETFGYFQTYKKCDVSSDLPSLANVVTSSVALRLGSFGRPWLRLPGFFPFWHRGSPLEGTLVTSHSRKYYLWIKFFVYIEVPAFEYDHSRVSIWVFVLLENWSRRSAIRDWFFEPTILIHRKENQQFCSSCNFHETPYNSFVPVVRSEIGQSYNVMYMFFIIRVSH